MNNYRLQNGCWNCRYAWLITDPECATYKCSFAIKIQDEFEPYDLALKSEGEDISEKWNPSERPEGQWRRSIIGGGVESHGICDNHKEGEPYIVDWREL